MSGFKFNFSNSEKGDENNFKDTNDLPKHWLECAEVFPDNEDKILVRDMFKECEINTLQAKNIIIKHFLTVDVFNVLRTNDSDSTKDLSVLCADCNHSDLQAAVYEGGLKIWECTYDLVNYIAETELELEEKHVLDLGCGAGLIGLVCLVNGASCVFQDYNIEVLQYITIPNIILNNEEYVKKSRFYSGDWQHFSETIKDQKKFDYIFTSETIYNTENYSKLHDIFERLLNKDGEIYLAAKSHYFGVGGGITLFKDYISKRNIFQATSCWKHSEGVTREILRLQFLKHKKDN